MAILEVSSVLRMVSALVGGRRERWVTGGREKEREGERGQERKKERERERRREKEREGERGQERIEYGTCHDAQPIAVHGIAAILWLVFWLHGKDGLIQLAPRAIPCTADGLFFGQEETTNRRSTGSHTSPLVCRKTHTKNTQTPQCIPSKGFLCCNTCWMRRWKSAMAVLLL